jgi:CDP-glycerol glycerophosphotransferase
MKLDKHNIRHWWYLLLFAFNVALAIACRPFRRRTGRRVLLYGHKLNGNLLAIQQQLRTTQPRVEAVFLTLDPSYHRELSRQGAPCVLATSLQCLRWLVNADAVISDHGLHAMRPMQFFSDLKFFDVWHGIPFKGFDADDFRVQQGFDEVWVASPLLRSLYIERFGFRPQQVLVTGYARTDRLVRPDEAVATTKVQLGLGDRPGKIVLFAPTWKQDAKHRGLYPFGIDEQAFLRALSELGRRTGATFLIRVHLNSTAVANTDFAHIVHVPHARFPDTEAVLLASDILVCDWSSIAFDYLLLDRPTVFLDVEPPFAKGLSLDASYRFGAIAGDMDDLLRLLERYLVDPDSYMQEFAKKHAEIKAKVYGAYADGNASVRCVERLLEHLATDESFR